MSKLNQCLDSKWVFCGNKQTARQRIRARDKALFVRAEVAEFLTEFGSFERTKHALANEQMRMAVRKAASGDPRCKPATPVKPVARRRKDFRPVQHSRRVMDFLMEDQEPTEPREEWGGFHMVQIFQHGKPVRQVRVQIRANCACVTD